MNCRFCRTPLSDTFIDLVAAPPSNAFLKPAQLDEPEKYFPLKLFTCSACHLVQVEEHQCHDLIFSDDYAYFSSYSTTWLEHASQYVELVVDRLGLGTESLVMEVASNDGYLLQYMKRRDIPCVGVEPAVRTARAAAEKGIETLESFFGNAVAEEFVAQRRKVDLVIGNNVLAHVPDLDDFVAGLRTVLAANGTITVEFPHLLQLVAHNQFDTVYQEHFSYLSFHTVQKIFATHGLSVWDVEELPTHGGSLRVWAQHHHGARPVSERVSALLEMEEAAGMLQMEYYRRFQEKADRVKNDFLAFLIDKKRAGSQVVGYGAAAKGNTFLNYAGVKVDLLNYVVDASPHKQGCFLPGSHIPVVDESRIRETKPDFVAILPWNLRDEIAAQLSYIRQWGGQFVVAVPSLDVFERSSERGSDAGARRRRPKRQGSMKSGTQGLAQALEKKCFIRREIKEVKRVLVTGASGFIGRWVLSPLLSDGYEVHAVSRSSQAESRDVTWHRIDLLDARQVKLVVKDVAPTHLLHLAWSAEPGQFWTSAENIEWVNASLTLLKVFGEQGGKRVVVAGTCAEYDWEHGYCSERRTPTRPRGLYGACKSALCEVTRAYCRGRDVSFAWGRVFWAYGPHEHPSRLVASVARDLLRGDVARCTDGKQVRDYLHVEDVASAFVALLNSERQGAVNIASGRPVSVKELVCTIADCLDARESVRFGALTAPENDAPLVVGDSRILRDEVGWSPKFDLARGIEQTVDFWRGLVECPVT